MVQYIARHIPLNTCKQQTITSPTQRSAMKIDLEQYIYALSDTIDLVGINETQHGKRVAFMATECAKLLGAGKTELTVYYRAGLLHDCGVSSTRVHKKLVNEIDWEGSASHCDIGAERMCQVAPLSCYADIIQYHHTPWEDLKVLKLSEEIKTQANLIYLTDRVDALAAMAETVNRLAARDAICRTISSMKDTHFKEELVDAFLVCAQKEAFWITQEQNHLISYLNEKAVDGDPVYLDSFDMKNMGMLFAHIVDAKSPYTAAHSIGVSQLAGYLAEKSALPDSIVNKIEIAGLLHDLGKLQMPDEVLECNSKLSDHDLSIMRHHSYITYSILHKIKGLEDICEWASNHHEKLDGEGYPFRKGKEELSIESRIIMVADIYQALAQHRPYRKPLSSEMILDYLSNLADDGKIDCDIVQIVMKDPNECHHAAIGM